MNIIARPCLLLFVVMTAQQATAADPFDGSDDFVRAAMKRWEAPGVAIAVVKDGEVVLTKGYGVTEIGSDRLVSQATLFDIASLTKSITAASVAVLVDQGKLDWDDPVSKHLPNIRFPDEYITRHVTLRDLLCHRTGLALGDMIFSQDNITRDELLRRTPLLKVAAPFRTQHTYNNVMYAILKEIVAKRAEQPWEQFVKENLLEPLAMNSTTDSIGENGRHYFAPRHWRDEGKITSRGIRHSAGTYSSAADMAKWMQCHLAFGRSGSRQVISEQSFREMHATQHSVPVRRTPEDNPYAARFFGTGMGWTTLDYRGRKLVMHTGAWGAIIGLVPEENLGVVVLTNLDWNYGMTGILMYTILDCYCTESDSIWNIDNLKQPYLEVPGKSYESRDRDRAKLDAARVKETKPTLNLATHTGQYRSSLFGDLQVALEGGKLWLRFGRFTTELKHWEHDVFYAKAPTRMNYDWLVEFDVTTGDVNAVTLKYVGWYEPDAVFQHVSKGE